ncbi:CHC2 zinc finger domain-containing protein [Massilia sp. Mn16-1_5]|uniref:CHC2 zinc finger domain-containing protein n=1 Tax=Massilia sp. Mn16-1_5 TaxID=2079199 RepID=UPI00109E5068|nr:CHC2 zinc finger domain-containing protein [Massilia sp. Mn16-1_5]THC40642.1 hypothetical protein C2862_21155 [Massilia sp. Mn16-1_5]
MIPQDYIQQLVLKADIAEIIGRVVSLKRVKMNFVGRCPFHQKEAPDEASDVIAFTVSPVKRFYHCFSCGAHGSVIGFMMKFNGLSFRDAVSQLAVAAAMDPPPEAEPSRINQSTEMRQMRETLETALRYYQGELPGADKAITLLKGAGISGATAKRFRIGYAPDSWDNLASVFGHSYRTRCAEAGLVVVKEEDGKAYDRLRDRIIFPTVNGRDQVLGLSGLAVSTRPHIAQYLRNTAQPKKRRQSGGADTIGPGAEDKGSMFGLQQAIVGMRAEGFAVLVQDCLDVLRLHEAGLRNAVAPSVAGKMRTENLTRLFRSTAVVTLCYPRTQRGARDAWAAMQAALPALRDDVQVRFALMPEGLGPGDVLRQTDGAALFRLLLDAAVPLSQYFLQGLASQADFRSIEGRSKVLGTADQMLERVVAPNFKAQLADAVQQLVDDQLELLDSVDEHDHWLANAIRTANSRLVIVSPWVTSAGIHRFNLCANIATAIARGVRVDIYTDPEFNTQLRRRSPAAQALGASAERELQQAGAYLHRVPRMHSKIVGIDDHALCIGSFNWLSAAKSGSYRRHEVSLVHRHGDVGIRIAGLLATLNAGRDMNTA